MRIWTLHPTELDKLRVRALHHEVHMILSHLAKGHQGVVVTPWSDDRGIFALVHLHQLIAFYPHPQLLNHTESTHPTWVQEIQDGAALEQHYRRAFKDYTSKGPKSNLWYTLSDSWPPPWTSIRQQIADLRDLQARWKEYYQRFSRGERPVEVYTCYKQSVLKYGEYQDGKLHGEATDPADITDDEVFQFLHYTQDKGGG